MYSGRFDIIKRKGSFTLVFLKSRKNRPYLSLCYHSSENSAEAEFVAVI